jgi:hypothetical protein
LSLQVLFAKAPVLRSKELTRTLRAFHPSLSEGTFEIDEEAAASGTPFGLAGWGEHVVRLVGFDAPMPAEFVENCVQPAHYGPPLKKQARAHQAHVILFYAGDDTSPMEQYLALAVVAGALASHGALIVCNESAHTSLPAQVLADPGADSDRLDVLRAMLLLYLFCGFVKYEVEDVDGVWMRTYGAHLLGLPDLAFRAESHAESENICQTFESMLRYLLDSGATFEAGHTMQVGEDLFARLRAPRKKEYYLDSPGELFVMELISEDEINR